VSQSCGLSAGDPRGNQHWDSKGKQRELLFFHQNNENSSNNNNKKNAGGGKIGGNMRGIWLV